MNALLLAVVLCLALLAIVWPMFNKNIFTDFMLEDLSDNSKQYKRDKATLIGILKELDFDFETEKISKEDYIQLRDKYKNQTLQLMKKIQASEDNKKKAQKKIEQTLYALKHQDNESKQNIYDVPTEI